MTAIISGSYTDLMDTNAELRIDSNITLYYQSRVTELKIPDIENYRQLFNLHDLETNTVKFLEAIRSAIIDESSIGSQIRKNSHAIKPYCLIDSETVDFGFSNDSTVFRMGITRISIQNSVI
jgi:23S rRNA C2498 (ribose-2'-O)-methylase RlmM